MPKYSRYIDEIKEFEKNGFVIIKNQSLISPEYTKKFYHSPNNYTIAISLENATRDIKSVIEAINNWSEQSKEISYKSIVFTIDDTNLRSIDNDTIVSVIKKVANYIHSQDRLSFISLGVTQNEAEGDDIFHSYNDKTKFLMNDIADLNLSDQVFLLDLENKEDLFNAADLNQIKANNLLVSENEIEDVRNKISQIANLIKHKTDSPYEQHLLALHYLSQYKYTLNDKKQPYLASRSLSQIVKNDAKYICCAAYAKYYVEVMRALGFEAQTQSVYGHLRAKVLMKEDRKYDVKPGVYVVDPTWLSEMQDHTGKKHSFSFSKLANLNFNSILNEVDIRFECDQQNPDAMKTRFNKEMALYLRFKQNLDKFGLLTLKELKDFTLGEYLETGAEFYYKIYEHINEIKDKEQLVKGSDIASFIDKIEPCEQKPDLEFFAFSSLTENDRKQKMQSFLDSVKDTIQTKYDINDYDLIKNYLYNNAIKFGIPKVIVSTAFLTDPIMIFNLPSNTSRLGIELVISNAVNNSMKNFFDTISEFAINSAAQCLYNKPDYLDEFRRKTLVSANLRSTLNQNFSSLSDEEFENILATTQTISQRTLEEAVSNIANLVKDEDYELFKQNMHGKGISNDPSMD